jgi:hypothetical protein
MAAVTGISEVCRRLGTKDLITNYRTPGRKRHSYGIRVWREWMNRLSQNPMRTNRIAITACQRRVIGLESQLSTGLTDFV